MFRLAENTHKQVFITLKHYDPVVKASRKLWVQIQKPLFRVNTHKGLVN